MTFQFPQIFWSFYLYYFLFFFLYGIKNIFHYHLSVVWGEDGGKNMVSSVFNCNLSLFEVQGKIFLKSLDNDIGLHFLWKKSKNANKP